MNELQKVQILECAKGKWQYQIAKSIIDNIEDGIINPCFYLQGRARMGISNYERSMFNMFDRILKLEFITGLKEELGTRGGLWKATFKFIIKE